MKKFDDFMRLEQEPFMDYFESLTKQLRKDPVMKDNNDAMVGTLAISLSIRLLHDYHNWLHDIQSETSPAPTQSLP